jgi:large subunit ribosomal protein L30
MPAKAAAVAMLRVTQVKSSISHIARNRATLRALGLHGIGSSVDVPANDATRGMVRQVRFLVSVEESAAPAGAQPSEGRGGGEHASERTTVRERASADANDGSRRISDGAEEAK